MSDTGRIEAIDIECAEEGRTAHLLVEWTNDGPDRRIRSIQCDNPKLARLEPWDCGWSCWKRVESLA